MCEREISARLKDSAGNHSLQIIRGTILWPVAYPLLQRSGCPVSNRVPNCRPSPMPRRILHLRDYRVEMNPILAHAVKLARGQANSLIGTPRLTYCPVERQIPAVRSGSGAGCAAKVSIDTDRHEPELARTGYRYPTSKSHSTFRISSQQHLARINVLKVKVNA
jgi:hypothetical protein